MNTETQQQQQQQQARRVSQSQQSVGRTDGREAGSDVTDADELTPTVARRAARRGAV